MSAPAPSRPLLSVRAVSKVYRMGEVDILALRNASLDVAEGEFLVIVGPSGSGKTTLLNILGGMDRPTTGTVTFLDRELTRASDRELTLYRRREVGFVFQFFNLVATLTALENVQVAVEIAEEPMDPGDALTLVGLSDRADHFPAQLSGGEQQRVAIARAVASNPRLLLCDEPTGSVDLETGRQILRLLAQLNESLGKTLVLITHNTAIADVGHRVAHMRDGAIHSIRVNATRKPAEQVQW